MALIDFDGFDFYAASGIDMLNRRGLLQWSIGAVGYASPGRNNQGTCIFMGQRSSIQGAITTPLASAYIGYGFKITSPSAGRSSFRFVDDTTTQICIVPNCITNRIDVYRSDPGVMLIGSSANNVFSPSAWNYLEAFATIHPTAGEINVRVNGQTVLHLTGINTRISANSTFNGVMFSGSDSGGDNQVTAYDDFYIADTTTGPGVFPFNTFVGDVRVVTLNPIGNAGTIQWTPFANTNWQEVSEVHNDGDASYNSTATASNEDLFNFAALTGTISQILAVQVIGSYRKDDAGTREITQQLKSGGTQVAGTTYTVPGSYIYATDTFVLDPNTAANWTVGAVNALQAGYVLTV